MAKMTPQSFLEIAGLPVTKSAVRALTESTQEVSEGRFVKGPGGIPLDRRGRPTSFPGFEFPEGGELGYKIGGGKGSHGMGHRNQGITIINRTTGEQTHYDDFTYFDEDPTQEDLEFLLED